MIAFWIIDMIIPITMIALGIYYNNKANMNISEKSGFRTAASMKSKEAWEYAHKLASKMLILIGILLICYIVLIKVIEPLSSEYLSLINNSVSILAYIFLTMYVNKKVKLIE